MKGIRGKLAPKLISMIVFAISAAVFFGSILGVAFMMESDAFFDNGTSLNEHILNSSITNKARDINRVIANYEPLGLDVFIPDSESKEYYWFYHYGQEEDSEEADPAFDYSDDDMGNTNVWYADEGNFLNDKSLGRIMDYFDVCYSQDDTNLSIEIYDASQNLLYKNFTIENPCVSSTQVVSVDVCFGRVWIRSEFLDSDEADDYVKMLGRTGYADELSVSSYENTDEYEDKIAKTIVAEYDDMLDVVPMLDPMLDPIPKTYVVEGYYYPCSRENLVMTLSLPQVLTIKDDVYIRAQKMAMLIEYKYLFVAAAAVSAILLIISFITTVCTAGYSENHQGIHLTLFDKCPLEVHLGVALGILALMVALFDEFVFSYQTAPSWVLITSAMIGIAVAALVFIVLLYTISARCKAGKLFHYTFVFGSLILLFKWAVHFFKNLKYVWKLVIILGFSTVYDAIYISLLVNREADMGAAIWFLGKVVVCIALAVYTIGFGRLRDCCKKISQGKTDTVVDKTLLPPDLRGFADDINSISNGIQIAVDNQTKSERLKTELITNVSHDLKTPLTSIVNYVDILSKEDIKPESAREYVDVLVRQSQRMKKLIDDLVEASKASSGVIPVNYERLDMSLLVTQAVTEYEERLERAGIEPVLKLSDEPVQVRVDGRLMWRVLDNLFGNICKYAQSGTRVYVAINVVGSKVSVTFKNVSRYALNITSDELMERFVRGDSSRHTEGSGLGLSIARSLCNLQGVGFGIDIDGDLFKAELTLEKLPYEPPKEEPTVEEPVAEEPACEHTEPIDVVVESVAEAQEKQEEDGSSACDGDA